MRGRQMVRREFLEQLTAVTVAGNLNPFPLSAAQQNGPAAWRGAVPALKQDINGKPLAYLDTAATALRPQAVIDAISAFYARDNANPGATLHTLARRANTAMEDARATVASFIGAADPIEVVFTRGTTEGLNLVAHAWGRANLKPGDEILISIAEH